MVLSKSAKSECYDIAIVGAGMVGMSFALMLAEHNLNWRILLIESRSKDTYSEGSGAFFDSRTTALARKSARILSRIGLDDFLRTQSTPIDCIHVSDKGSAGITRISATDAEVCALGYVVENRGMSDVLIEMCKDKQIETFFSTSVEELILGKAALRLRLKDVATSIKARLLVIADGADSKTAKKLGIRTFTYDDHQTAIVANISHQNDHKGVAYERFTTNGHIALLPTSSSQGHYRSSLVWVHTKSEICALLEVDDRTFLDKLQDQFGYRSGRFIKVGAKACYPVRTTLAEEQFRSNIVLLGNAAHGLTPIAGQGFNLAIRDAACLARVVSAMREKGLDFGALSVLEDYQNQQMLDQKMTVEFTLSLPKLFASTNPAVINGRKIGLVTMDAIKPFRRNFAQFGMGSRMSRHCFV